MQSIKRSKYDCIIIGGGFFGCVLALHLRTKYEHILIIEQESDVLLRASLNNQARVHNGYHYPRALATMLSSARHFPHFCEDFKEAIVNDFKKFYGIARIGSKTSSRQFYRLFKQFDIFIESAPSHIKAMFENALVSDVFCVREYAFNANILRKILRERLESCGITIATDTSALKVAQNGNAVDIFITDSKNHKYIKTTKDSTNTPLSRHNHLLLHNDTQILCAPLVLNCTYAGINTLLQDSGLPPLPLKYELTEMALVSVPDELKGLAFTLMDGAFFSLMPYPAKDCYTLSHVRYTPHLAWQDTPPFTQTMQNLSSPYMMLQNPPQSRFVPMKADCARFMPLIKELEYLGSLWEIKTLQIYNERDDGRPIVFARDYGIKGFCVIMGGKIDNIYEIIAVLNREFHL